jgi:hypothetical protein
VYLSFAQRDTVTDGGDLIVDGGERLSTSGGGMLSLTVADATSLLATETMSRLSIVAPGFKNKTR